MNVHIPPALASMSPQLREFFDAMVHKLNVNVHKNPLLSADDVDGLLAKMQEEIGEFREQMVLDATDPNMLSELADASNFAFLTFAYLRGRGLQDLREQFISEYFFVNTAIGKVYCTKTRAGSPLKLGDEIPGTVRNGVTYIRAQHSSSGAMVSLPRRDIIWWSVTGKWPERPLRYKEESSTETRSRDGKVWATGDRFNNLELTPPRTPDKLPFVSQYKPAGREANANYGRWVYQRRHNLKLIRCGYYDTPEDAARDGLKAWKEKTKCSK